MGKWGAEPSPTSKILPFRRAKMVVKCTSAGKDTGQRTNTIGELLLLKQRSQTKTNRRQPLTPLKS